MNATLPTDPAGLAAHPQRTPHARPAVIPWRWHGHWLDICTTIDAGRTLFIARDIHEALAEALPEHLEEHPGHDAPLAEHAHGISWSLEQTQAVIAASGHEHAPALAAFVQHIHTEINAWPDQAVAKAATPHLAQVTVLRPAGDTTEHDTAAAVDLPPYYSVAIAAKILSRDPAIDVGRQRLFDFMHSHSWVHRDPKAGYLPTKEHVFLGHLTTVPVHIPGRTYLQVCVTPDGLQQLHHLLGGVAVLDLKPVDATLI